MQRSTPSPELAARIQSLIDGLEAEGLGAWPVRVCRDTLNALPLHGQVLFLWALRPDGTVLCMDHEAFGHPTEPETDPLTLYAVLSQGARAYPELQEFVPPAPQGVLLCNSCGGSGGAEEAGGNYCYGCRGLGWYVPYSAKVQDGSALG